MPRPLPNIPRLHRRKRAAPSSALLACPRISPHWEFGALRALIKPQLKDAIAHRSPQQVLPADARARVDRILATVAERLAFAPAVHWPAEGDYVFVAQVDSDKAVESRALALALSHGLPDVWLVLGRLFVRDGRFFRRERGYRLDLVPASNVHLTRPIRAALHGVL